MNPADFGDPLTFHSKPHVNLMVALEKTTTGWIAKTFSADIHVPVRMSCHNFSVILTFPIAPSSGETLNVSSILWFMTKYLQN